MGAPVPAARVTPSGKKLKEGYQTLVAFTSVPNIAFWEKSITAPGIETEEGADLSTMHNVRWIQKSSRRLVTLTEFSMIAYWDPKVYVDILALVPHNTTVTVHFPDGSSLAFYGYIRSFKPGSLEYGKVPEATLTVTPTNTDPTDCSEQGPTYTAGAGTGPCA